MISRCQVRIWWLMRWRRISSRDESRYASSRARGWLSMSKEPRSRPSATIKATPAMRRRDMALFILMPRSKKLAGYYSPAFHWPPYEKMIWLSRRLFDYIFGADAGTGSPYTFLQVYIFTWAIISAFTDVPRASYDAKLASNFNGQWRLTMSGYALNFSDFDAPKEGPLMKLARASADIWPTRHAVIDDASPFTFAAYHTAPGNKPPHGLTGIALVVYIMALMPLMNRLPRRGSATAKRQHIPARRETSISRAKNALFVVCAMPRPCYLWFRLLVMKL